MRRALLALLAPLALAGCGDETPAPSPQSFAPLHYEYLSKLRLNVGQVEVTDHSLPVGPQDVASSSPVPPAQALAQMARDRLFAAGSGGTASFIIDQASIVREPNGTLDGQLAVHVQVASGTPGQTGFAEARVARQHVPGSDPENDASNLYQLTRDMMDAMNVELEYQVRRSLKAELVSAGGVPLPVVAQKLGGPGAPGPVVSAAPQVATTPDDVPSLAPADVVPAPAPPTLPPAVPDAPQDGYQDPAAPPPTQMSPPPGYLQAPPGVAPVQ